ncbi:MAG: hypothetical protein GXP33_05615 [Spirochaetes bacterium]|nr:hypothetical protein [Spirochaetota bacterium]
MEKGKNIYEIGETELKNGEKISSLFCTLFGALLLIVVIMFGFKKNNNTLAIVLSSADFLVLFLIFLFGRYLIKKEKYPEIFAYFSVVFSSLGGVLFLAVSYFLFTANNLKVLVFLSSFYLILAVIINIFRLKILFPVLTAIIGTIGTLFIALSAVFIKNDLNELIVIFLVAGIMMLTGIISSFVVYRFTGILEKNMVTEELLRSSRRLRMTLEIVEASIVSLGNFVSNLDEIAERLSRGARNQLSSIEMISQEAEKLQKSMGNISQASEISENTIKRTADFSNNGNLILKRVIQEILGIHEVVDKMVASLDLIDEIADQTNLLSLNATIEASRAGEEGTGFSVLAGEIRKLAERSSETASEIGRLVKQIERVIFNGGESSKEAGKIFDSINKDLNVYSNFVHNLHMDVQNQLTSNKEVTHAIERIGTVTKENTLTSEQIEEVLSLLREEVNMLKGLVEGKMIETARLSHLQKI